MKRRSFLPNDPKIVVCIYFGAFWICNKVFSYGRLTINFRIDECRTKKALKYIKIMLPLFRAVVKFFDYIDLFAVYAW